MVVEQVGQKAAMSDPGFVHVRIYALRTSIYVSRTSAYMCTHVYSKLTKCGGGAGGAKSDDGRPGVRNLARGEQVVEPDVRRVQGPLAFSVPIYIYIDI